MTIRIRPPGTTKPVSIFLPTITVTTNLFRKLIKKDSLGVHNIQMRQQYEDLPHLFVKNDRIDFLQKFTNNFTLVVLND